MSDGPDDPLEPAWQQVLDAWEEDAAHKKFLALCAATDRLGEAGRRYRAVKEAGDERAERAQEQIDRLLGLAMQNLSELKTGPPKKSTKSIMFLIAFAVSATMIISALWMLLRSF